MLFTKLYLVPLYCQTCHSYLTISRWVCDSEICFDSIHLCHLYYNSLFIAKSHCKWGYLLFIWMLKLQFASHRMEERHESRNIYVNFILSNTLNCIHNDYVNSCALSKLTNISTSFIQNLGWSGLWSLMQNTKRNRCSIILEIDIRLLNFVVKARRLTQNNPFTIYTLHRKFT